eukprot:GHVL01024588.1.p1 GENE.GHVL01024588.1~~GHVL01024588.1.p1  ORF type:complete len:270 (+),score=29.17 GHVL01024588.1:86-895(+)
MIKIIEREGRGRCVVAEQEFFPGDEIVKSFSFALVLQLTLWNQRCQQCFESNTKLLMCASCKMCMYCSKECQTQSWRAYHKVECQCLQSVIKALGCEQVHDVLLATRLFMRHFQSSEGDFLGKVWAMCDHLDTSHFSKVNNLTATAMIFQKILLPNIVKSCMKYYNKSEKVFSQDWFNSKIPFDVYNIESLVRLFSKFECNNFYVANELFVPILSGVYPVGAALNHSCLPNCIPTYPSEFDNSSFFGSIQSFKCLKKIEKDVPLREYLL